MVSVKRDLERVRYWQGQLLTAADLREQIATDIELRRLHDRFAHRAVGIAIGLSTQPDDTNTALVVDAGLAYDASSRPLILPERRSIALPGASEPLPQVLVLAFDERDATGIALRWRRERDWNGCEGIALHRFHQLDPASDRELDPSFRPVVARPLARPHTVAGQTIPGETAWQPWSLGGLEVGVQVRVDTSAAGFSATPHYFADAIAGLDSDEIQPGWFASIGDPSETEFTLRLLFRGITTQSLVFVDPRPRVLEAARLDDIELDEGDLAFADPVVRLVPVMPRARQVESIDENAALQLVQVPKWLQSEVPEPDDLQRLGVCLLPRRAVVRATSSGKGQGLVESNASLDEDQYLIRVAALESSPPPASSLVKVIDTFEGGLIVLSAEVPGVKTEESFAKVESSATVSAHAEGKKHVTVTNAQSFKEHALAILIKDNVADIVKIDEFEENTLILATALDRVDVGDALSAVTKDEVELSAPRPQSAWQRITFQTAEPVDAVKRFERGDLVAPAGTTGSADAQFYRVEAVSKEAILLERPIPGPSEDRELVAATVGARATVRSVLGSFVTVDAPERFAGGFVARVTAEYELETPAWVVSASSTGLSLAAGSPTLNVGDVIARCDFPRSVRVSQVRNNRQLIVDDHRQLRTGDVVMRLPKKGDPDLADGHEAVNVTWIESAAQTVVLARELTHLAAGDQLLVANLGQVATATKEDDDLKVIDRRQLRAGDAVGTIVTWRQSEIEATWANVIDTQTFTLSAWPDGLLPGDIVGLPSARFPDIFVRLEAMRGLRLFDIVSLTGTDVALEQEVAAQATITIADATGKRLQLVVTDAPEARGREYRPDDLTATAPFLRGSALEVIRNQDLFVSWLAVEEPLPMPRQLLTPKPPECPCVPALDVVRRSATGRKEQD
jgi:hypothetical protein